MNWSKEDEHVKQLWTDERLDRQTMDNRPSDKTTWAVSSGGLKQNKTFNHLKIMQSELKLKKKKNKEAPVMNAYYFKILKKLSFTKKFFFCSTTNSTKLLYKCFNSIQQCTFNFQPYQWTVNFLTRETQSFLTICISSFLFHCYTEMSLKYTCMILKYEVHVHVNSVYYKVVRPKTKSFHFTSALINDA